MIREALTDHDIEHRREDAEYATQHSPSEWHRDVFARLSAHWVSINGDHFEGTCRS
jgi:hypothetical protein